MPAVSVYTFKRSRECSPMEVQCSPMEVLAEVLQLLGIAAFIALSTFERRKRKRREEGN